MCVVDDRPIWFVLLGRALAAKAARVGRAAGRHLAQSFCRHQERIWRKRPGRAWTECTRCGHESVGWEIAQ